MRTSRLGVLVAGIGLVVLTGAAGAAQPLRTGQAAPELAGGPWINSGPLTLSGLRGRVVAVEFWTYG